MPRRDWKLRAEDILQAIRTIERHTQGMTLEGFSADDKTRDAVAPNLTVIGEAARHIPDDVLARYPEIPWAEVRAMRNALAHEYFRIALPIIWDTIRQDLQPLAGILQRMLEEQP